MLFKKPCFVRNYICVNRFYCAFLRIFYLVYKVKFIKLKPKQSFITFIWSTSYQLKEIKLIFKCGVKIYLYLLSDKLGKI